MRLVIDTEQLQSKGFTLEEWLVLLLRYLNIQYDDTVTQVIAKGFAVADDRDIYDFNITPETGKAFSLSFSPDRPVANSDIHGQIGIPEKDIEWSISTGEEIYEES